MTLTAAKYHTLFDFLLFFFHLLPNNILSMSVWHTRFSSSLFELYALRFSLLDANVSQEVTKLLRVVLQHQKCGPMINLNHEKHNSFVHCGRTKVFLTQPTVSSQARLCTSLTTEPGAD